MNDANNAGAREPTTEMIDRGVAFALSVSLSGEYNWSQYIRDLYCHMVVAAPNAPVEQREATTSKMEVVQQREAIGLALRRFHQNSCYPQASDGEIDIAIAAILAVRLNEAAIRKDEREKCAAIATSHADKWESSASNANGDVDFNFISKSARRSIADALNGIAYEFAQAKRDGGKQP